MSKRVGVATRRKATRGKYDRRFNKADLLKLVDELRMQARTNAAAYLNMKVEPRDATKHLEWRAADVIERLTKNL
jgi:hypothetical protein